MHDTPFRSYDPQLGRFWGVDALADYFASITSYQYAYNNPIGFNDPTGLAAESVGGESSTQPSDPPPSVTYSNSTEFSHFLSLFSPFEYDRAADLWADRGWSRHEGNMSEIVVEARFEPTGSYSPSFSASFWRFMSQADGVAREFGPSVGRFIYYLNPLSAAGDALAYHTQGTNTFGEETSGKEVASNAGIEVAGIFFTPIKIVKAAKPAAKFGTKVPYAHNVGNALSGVGRGNSLVPNIGKKLDFVFGKATGRLHNIQRSTAMQRQLNSIGIFDNEIGRSYLNSHLGKVLNNSKNILSSKDGFITRESLLMGLNGGLKMQSVWKGQDLITIKLMGR
ncbi:MAG: hypothetical protein JJT94_11710 [Bernardetiaceae bacterium]|nr:hypothetical protein [Bernardetiaceae bacterium]